MDENLRIVSKGPVRLQYYVPFWFNENRFDAVNSSFGDAVREDGESRWESSPFPLLDRRRTIYDHVLAMFNDPDYGVCMNWQYLPPIEEKYLLKDKQSGNPVFSFSNVYVHLFRCGIGFLCFQLIIENDGIQTSGQLVRFQQKIRMLESTRLYIANAPDSRPVLAGSLIRDLLAGTCDGLFFFGGSGKSTMPQTALLFSYLCYECDDRNQLQEITVHAATGYSRMNVQSESAIQSCGSLANNVCFYVSRNGCAFSIQLQEQNRHFFLENPPVRLYHFIYLFSLYQYYSLLNFTMRIYREFPSASDADLNHAAYADRMHDFIADLNNFLLKSDVATVSLEPYHNDFYAACRKALNIEEEKQSIQNRSECLVKVYANTKVSRQKPARREERDKTDARDKNRYAFISYCTEQQVFADTLKRFLNHEGVQAWKAPEDIPPGSKFAAAINKAIQDSACFVLLLSNEAQQSPWVEKEVERAINYRKTIIPVRIEKMKLNDQFELYISTDQIIMLDAIDEHSEKTQLLLSVIRDYI